MDDLELQNGQYLVALAPLQYDVTELNATEKKAYEEYKIKMDLYHQREKERIQKIYEEEKKKGNNPPPPREMTKDRDILPSKMDYRFEGDGYHPMYLSRENSGNYHINFLRTGNSMNVELSSNSIKYQITGGILDFHFFVGDNKPENCLRQYHHYLGGHIMPPFSAFGVSISASHPETTLEVVK